MQREGGFAFIGMGSQYALCFPGKDLIFACISDTQGAGPTGTGVIEPFYDEIFYKVKDSPLPEDAKSHTALKGKILDLKILPQREILHHIQKGLATVVYTERKPHEDHQDAFDL